MKLISCYIENYGKLKKKEYVFDKGITSFCEENGSGKSTLASFLKAMFYGLDNYRKNTKDFVDRLHFYPFEGGQFGGNLVFEMEGDTYKIERFFDETSETRDKLSVYKNGSLFDGFGNDVGKNVFGVDAASFERTAFVGSSDIEIASTISINAKLNRFRRGADADEGDLEGALSILDKESKLYKKAKAGKDRISEVSAQIDDLDHQITNLQSIKEGLEGRYLLLAQKKKALRESEEALAKAQELSLVLKDWERYEALLAEAEAEQESYEALLGAYPKGVPTKEELDASQKALLEEEKLAAKAKVETFSASDEEDYCIYNAMFAKGVPDEEALSGLGKQIEEKAKLSSEIATLDLSVHDEKEALLATRFAAGLPCKELLNKAEVLAKDYRKSENAYREAPAYLTSATPAVTVQKQSPKYYLPLSVAAGVLALLGVILLFVSLYVGIALTVVGVVGLFIIGFLYLNQKTSAATVSAPMPLENPEKAELLAAANAISESLRAILEPYGYLSGDGILVDYAAWKRDAEEYASRLADQEKRAVRLAEKKALFDRLQADISAVFATYGICEAKDTDALFALQNGVRRYAELSLRRKTAQEAKATLDAEHLAVGEKLRAFTEKYALGNITVQLLQKIASDLASLERLSRKAEEKRREADGFKGEKGLLEKPSGEVVDFSLLQEHLGELRMEISRLDRQVEDEERTVEDLDFHLDEKEKAKELLAEYETRHKLLMAARTLLTRAEANMKERFVKPIKDQFTAYAALLEETLGEKITMDRNYEIRFERFGKERDDKHLSTGQRSLCTLAFRLALISHMYPEEKPFLILDDPFLALDAGHMAKVKTLLTALSGDMQIIYLTCHESRML